MRIILEIKTKYGRSFYGPFEDQDAALVWITKNTEDKKGSFSIEFKQEFGYAIVLAVKNEPKVGPHGLTTRTDIGKLHYLNMNPLDMKDPFKV